MGKNTWNTNKNDNIEKQVIRWEDLMGLKDSTANAIIMQQHLTNTLILKTKDIINSNPKLRESIVGLLNSYKDIILIINENMKKHITMDESNLITDYRKGVIDINSEDYLEFFKISSDYINAQEQIANLSFTGYTEILSMLAELDPNIVSQLQLDEMKKTYEDGVKSVQGVLKGVNNGKTKSKAKSKTRKK